MEYDSTGYHGYATLTSLDMLWYIMLDVNHSAPPFELTIDDYPQIAKLLYSS